MAKPLAVDFPRPDDRVYQNVLQGLTGSVNPVRTDRKSCGIFIWCDGEAEPVVPSVGALGHGSPVLGRKDSAPRVRQPDQRSGTHRGHEPEDPRLRFGVLSHRTFESKILS